MRVDKYVTCEKDGYGKEVYVQNLQNHQWFSLSGLRNRRRTKVSRNHVENRVRALESRGFKITTTVDVRTKKKE